MDFDDNSGGDCRPSFRSKRLYFIAVVHRNSRLKRIGDSARSKVTNRLNPSEMLGSQIALAILFHMLLLKTYGNRQVHRVCVVMIGYTSDWNKVLLNLNQCFHARKCILHISWSPLNH